jgi:hypothetical protein
VSRSLAACEGALLVVDASQGVEAQTLANVWLALENDLEVIPVLNKIDLPGGWGLGGKGEGGGRGEAAGRLAASVGQTQGVGPAVSGAAVCAHTRTGALVVVPPRECSYCLGSPRPLPRCAAGADCDRVIKEIEEIIGLDCTNILRVSAKMGLGIAETLEAIVERVPPPPNTSDKPLRALIFDSYYDAYRGVVCQFKVRLGLTPAPLRPFVVAWLPAPAAAAPSQACTYLLDMCGPPAPPRPAPPRTRRSWTARWLAGTWCA